MYDFLYFKKVCVVIVSSIINISINLINKNIILFLLILNVLIVIYFSFYFFKGIFFIQWLYLALSLLFLNVEKYW